MSTSETASKMDALQRRVAAFVKKFEQDSQGECARRGRAIGALTMTI